MTHYVRDLHGLTVQQAKSAIVNLIRNPKTSKITLIHGFNRGTALRNYIWNQMPSGMRGMGVTKQIRFYRTTERGRTTFGFIRASKSKSSNIGDLFDVDELLEQAGFSTLVESDVDSDADDFN